MQQRPRPPEVPETTPQDAWQRTQAGDAVIVDVREPEELSQFAVPGAIEIPLGALDAYADELPRDRSVLMLCRSGYRSAFATKFLLDAGFSSVENITGGIIAWSEAGLPRRRNE